MSQRQLAFEGCTPAYISRIEAGARVPSLQVLEAFAERLGVSVEYLATGAERRDDVEELLRGADLDLRLGERDEAERRYREVLARDGCPEASRARALAGLGELALTGGDHRGAISWLEQALRVDGLPPDEQAAISDRLGRAYSIVGEFDAAAALFERQLEAAKALGDQLGVLRFSTLLANVALDRGDLTRAEELLGRAIPVAEESRDPLDRARLWWSQSRLHTLENHPELAARYARMALELLDATEHLGFAALAFQLLAHIENDRGNGEEALRLVEQGYPMIVASHNSFHQALFELERARALLSLGKPEEAASVAMATLPLLAEASPNDAGRAYTVVADVFKALGDTARAIELYELAAETLPAGDRYLIAVFESLAELFEADGRHHDALNVLKKALRVQRVGVPESSSRT